MKMTSCLPLLWLCAASAAFAQPAPAAAPAPLPQAVDQLFSAWDKADTPGCTVAVMRDGKIVYQRGYGMADLERGAANGPQTVFHVASMSKQFTAFAIHLLAQDGKLALGDDVRKYLPELHDFGNTITIEQLLHHTSGLRDQWNLLALAGWRLDDVITEDDILRLLWRQRELNFAPGKEFLYSNSGYTLLGLIVKRVSGKSLAAFAQERIFAPLGMQHTQFHDDYQVLVKDRASSYVEQAPGRYQYVALSYSNAGATSLLTTVGDLARWDENFYDGKVGGKALLAQMQQRGELGSGKRIDYGSGLMLGAYRGLSTVAHGGADAGFRSELLRFPEQHVSVAVLANAGSVGAGTLAQRVADLYLDKVMSPAPKLAAAAAAAAAPAEIKLDAAALESFVGDYAITPQFVISVRLEEGQLTAQASGQPKLPIYAFGPRSFFSKLVDAQLSFDAPGADGKVGGAVLHQHGRDVPARRVAVSAPTAAQLAARVGEFYSDELHVLYTIDQRKGQLLLHTARAEVPLAALTPDSYVAEFPIGKVNFACDAGGKDCNGFTIDNGRVRRLAFTRVTVRAVQGHQEGASIVVPDRAPPPPYASEAIYLRGSMNGWGLADRLQPTSAQRYETRIVLDAGRYQFKVGSEDFASIDFGAPYHQETTALGTPIRMEASGENFVLDVPARASYVFTLDTREARAPRITVVSKQ